MLSFFAHTIIEDFNEMERGRGFNLWTAAH